jgi:hypothetical protein
MGWEMIWETFKAISRQISLLWEACTSLANKQNILEDRMDALEKELKARRK